MIANLGPGWREWEGSLRVVGAKKTAADLAGERCTGRKRYPCGARLDARYGFLLAAHETVGNKTGVDVDTGNLARRGLANIGRGG